MKNLYNTVYWPQADFVRLAHWIKSRQERGLHCFGVMVSLETSQIKIPKARLKKFHESWEAFKDGGYILKELGD